MDISKNSMIRFIMYIGVIVTSANIYNYVYLHFLYAIRGKVLCPALGSVSMCELGLTAGYLGVVTGHVLAIILFLKSIEKLKHSKILNRLEYIICATQVPLQLWIAAYFTYTSTEAGSTDDIRVTLFISYFCFNALLFGVNGILCYLEQITRERYYQ